MRLAINGFGRIGRAVFKIAFEKSNIEIVAINDLTSVKTLAHLLRYDSTYGVYGRKVEVVGNSLLIDRKTIPVYSEKEPNKLPWKELKVDVVVESTGIFRAAQSNIGGYMDHVKAGARKVILTVPSKDSIATIVLGVNDQCINKEVHAYSNASCTTNCLAPVAKVLNDKFSILRGFMTTVHAYTNDQVILDLPHPDLRRARSAATNIIPTSTGAAAAIGEVIPELNGKLAGYALRVPVPVGSIVDFTAQLEDKEVTKEAINEAFKTQSENLLKGIMEYTEEPIVLSDIVGNPHSCIVDAKLTDVLEKGLVKVVAWYDNEWGYSNRVVSLANKISEI